MSSILKLTFATLSMAATGLVVAQHRVSAKKPVRPAEGKVASADEPDFTRFRVVTDEGILAVYDADEEWDGRDEPASQLAYWNDFATQQLFFFDQLLFTPDDVLQSVAAMQRDLQIDPAQMLNEKPELHPLPEITMPGQWIPATEIDVLTVMAGGTLGANDSGGVSGLADPCVPGDCDALAMTSGPLAAPVRGTSRSELFASAQAGSNCGCGGGGGFCPICLPGPSPPCDDGNPCTNDFGPWLVALSGLVPLLCEQCFLPVG